ncbi:hypothetical protein SAMN04487948_104129 [Halogranum amylolyticum]|uniref:C2H2-type domain-containing protein n=1 Tax=Halogranum amylolyticum TaxID=660520 RepID=A0A1H8RNJ9_9EURY|nr:hypothetical protein [Halogranum amylolyticum]SEO67758.1 hypothetical protein SAMN04487948_104129 [Halogranum amylolyticum]
MELRTYDDMSQVGLVTCPLCRHDYDRREGLREHIMVDHRKSAVTDELLSQLGKRAR